MRMPDRMIVWAVYDHPRGFPDVFVAQKWEVTPQGSEKTDIIKTDPDLDNLRRRLIDEEFCGGCLPARPDDDPEAIELWLPASLMAN
jgi:hypothetical protein